jgi:hypothetical protein
LIAREEQDRQRSRVILWIGVFVATPAAMVALFAILFLGFPGAGLIFMAAPLAYAVAGLIAALVGRGRLVSGEPLGHPAPRAPTPRPSPLVYRSWPGPRCAEEERDAGD